MNRELIKRLFICISVIFGVLAISAVSGQSTIRVG